MMELHASCAVKPGLAVILVGHDPASKLYFKNKIRACNEVGIDSTLLQLEPTVEEAELLAHIDELNQHPQVHGILIQLPLPRHINMDKILERIAVEKDVDGLHLQNLGALVSGNTVFSPCTPFGVQKLLEHEAIDVEGRNVVVVRASNVVGKPLALMLMRQDATVCICHQKPRDLAQFTLLAVAAGVPGLIIPQMVQTGLSSSTWGSTACRPDKSSAMWTSRACGRRPRTSPPFPGAWGP